MIRRFILKKNTKVKAFIILIILFLIYSLLSAISYANFVNQDMKDEIFRLHVIAASDEVEDQELKLLVRDNILKYMNEINKDVTSKEELLNLMNENLKKFESIAKNTVIENDYDYDITASIGEYDFPTKSYGDITLPAGNYNSLRIKIGKAERSKLVVCFIPSIMFCRC